MSSLKGSAELKARLKAVKTAFKPLGRDWGEDAKARLLRGTPVKTGKTARAYRVNASLNRARVMGRFTAFFIDAGTRAHEEVPKKGKALRFQGRSGVVFTKRVQHPRVAPRPFRARAAHAALEANSPLQAVVKQWNEAAK